MPPISIENNDTRSIVFKSDQIVHRLYRKLGSAVDQARTSSRKGQVPGETKDLWFNIETFDSAASKESTQLYRSISQSAFAAPFNIQVLLVVPRLSRDDVLVHSRSGPHPASQIIEPTPSHILLETWTITHIGRRARNSDEHLPHHTYKECIPLFRAIYTLLRIMPAWNLDTRLTRQSRGTSNPRFRMIVQFNSAFDGTLGNDQGPLPVSNLTSLLQESYVFAPITHTTGVLQVSVRWLEDPSFYVMNRGTFLSALLEEIPEIPMDNFDGETVSTSRASTPSISIKPQPVRERTLSFGAISIPAQSELPFYGTAPSLRPRSGIMTFANKVQRIFKRFSGSVQSSRPSSRASGTISTGPASPTLSSGNLTTPLQVNLPFIQTPDETPHLSRRSSLLWGPGPISPSDAPPLITSSFTSSEDPHLLTLLRFVVNSPDRIELLLQLDESDVQHALDATQKLLDDINFQSTGFTIKTDPSVASHRIRRLLLKMVLRYDKLPEALFLSGVQLDVENDIANLSGGYSDVYIGSYGTQRVAVKRLRVFSSMEESKRDEVKRSFYHEAITWRTLSHRYILPFLGIDSNRFKPTLCMVAPWMERGTVRDTIDRMKSKEKMRSEALFSHVQRWIFEVAQGLAYLHEENVVHGDLRCANILVDDDLHIKLSDFGLSVFADGSSKSYASMRAGNPRWLAPELIDPDEFGLDSRRPTFCSDIYSFACVLTELYTCKAPFSEIDRDHAVSVRVMNGSRPTRPHFHEGEVMSEALWILTTRCWSQQASDRPSADHILQQLSSMQA